MMANEEPFNIVRHNLLKDKNYSPYCCECRTMERMRFDGKQFYCRHCANKTNFDADFILKLVDFRKS